MNLKMTRVDMWAADIEDQPGALARALRALADYGADLENVMARRQPDKPGKGVVFVSPLKGVEQLGNAGEAGFRRINVPMLKLEGSNELGIGAKLAKAIADAGVNASGLSASALGHRFVCYVTFDSLQDVEKAESALKPMMTHSWHFWPHHETKAA